MPSVVVSLLHSLRFLFRSPASLHLEILTLRHQLAVVHRSRRPRHRFTSADRLLCAGFSRTWHGWLSAVHIVQTGDHRGVAPPRFSFVLDLEEPTTHRAPSCAPDVGALIRVLSSANRRWGAPPIHFELQKLGNSVSQSTVAKYLRRHPRTGGGSG